jgi:hypothetical protein
MEVIEIITKKRWCAIYRRLTKCVTTTLTFLKNPSNQFNQVYNSQSNLRPFFCSNSHFSLITRYILLTGLWPFLNVELGKIRHKTGHILLFRSTSRNRNTSCPEQTVPISHEILNIALIPMKTGRLSDSKRPKSSIYNTDI